MNSLVFMRRTTWFVGVALSALMLGAGSARAAPVCARNLTANVVAFDQIFHYNRLGAFNPAGMIFALARDVINNTDGQPLTLTAQPVVAGNVSLRPDKRPRPLTLRMNEGDCLQIHFQNLLATTPVDAEQPITRTASIHVIGMQLETNISDDGSNVGQNASSLVSPGGTAVYNLYAEKEGTFLLYSTAATTGGEGNGGSLAAGLFGAINVEPLGAEWYRSQVTEEELRLALDLGNPNSCNAPATPGYTCDGHPLLDYDATYPNDCAAGVWCQEGKAGKPILNMLDGTEIFHSDLTAIITGPNKGDHNLGTYAANPVYEPNRDTPQAPGLETRNRHEPFREYTIIFHDEAMAIQAFDGLFEDPVLGHTLHSARDSFAINYGIGGIGAEVIANRLGVGPMQDCNECKYEEFFLSSWTVGDPAMVVDVPASNGLNGITLLDVETGNVPAGDLGPKATKALYPADPSNVYHSYLGDHLKFRNLHAGPKEHHIFHLHAHQWLFTPQSDLSAYLDSQSIGPGSHYTYETVYNGSGNRNQTVGDSIFHCHFYPHFAQGMWALWRVHDTFEKGTLLDVSGGAAGFHTAAFGLQDGTPALGARALPDAEILAGTPIPAVVPLPTLAMAPMPGPVHIDNGQTVVDNTAVNPGYPFFVPGKAGHRAPHPPLDTVDDGGLPRHVVLGGETHFPVLNRNDFSKENVKLDVEFLPETGTDVEVTAMGFHAQRTHGTVRPDGTADSFVTNGRPARAGAPYADPCVDDFGQPLGVERQYKSAHIQLDMKINKAGDHFPQARIHSLWEDVAAFQGGTKAPEPLFFRANSNDCVVYHLANLLPGNYEQDDFQVRTPTDITGQHIHLVKFDVTSSDGAANGFNYEDGAFAPDEVIERIDAINLFNADLPVPPPPLVPETHELGVAGAQTIVQVWYADNVLNSGLDDRTLRTVYTHDHFSPSTHQQTGLYAGLVVEPEGSDWGDPETGELYGTRPDGGPTSWRADILIGDESYREFLVEFADFQLAYEAGGGGTWQNPIPDPAKAINPPGREQIGLPLLVARPDQCPGGVAPPCPEIISADDPGMFSVNYRTEPLAYRIMKPVDPNNPTCNISGNPLTSDCVQAPGVAGDLAYAFRSDVTRAIPAFNSQPGFYPPLTGGVLPGDPYTPLMRAYTGDDVQVRILVGAQEEGHNFTIHGLKWLMEPGDPVSGWRNNQMMGISEHFEMEMPLTAKAGAVGAFKDYLWSPDISADGLWNGAWGILRAYNLEQSDLLELPNNPIPSSGSFTSSITNEGDFAGVCPAGAPVRSYNVFAISAAASLPGGTLEYNSRVGAFGGHPGPLHDPTALLYVLEEDLDVTRVGRSYVYTLKAGAPIEPLILRANAGDCISVTLRNTLPVQVADLDGFNLMPMIIEGFNVNQVKPSSSVGLHSQLVASDVSRYNGINVGKNVYAVQTAGPRRAYRYFWYAGHLSHQLDGTLVGTPVEFGATNLTPADPIKHSHKGLVGALIVLPQGSTWAEDPGTRAAATVTTPTGSFRDLVVVMQDDIQMRDVNGLAICPPEGNGEEGGGGCKGTEDAEDSANKAINYKSEPLWFRMGFDPGAPFGDVTGSIDFTDALANSLPGVGGDPETPVFTASVGEEVRMRVLQPGGHPRNRVFQVHGHIWEKQPYVAGAVPSQWIGDNPESEWYGAQAGHGPGNHFDMVLQNGAGGAYGVPGDYLYRDQASFQFDGGAWGILRVTP